jgi:hypothetical protein
MEVSSNEEEQVTVEKKCRYTINTMTPQKKLGKDNATLVDRILR